MKKALAIVTLVLAVSLGHHQHNRHDGNDIGNGYCSMEYPRKTPCPFE